MMITGLAFSRHGFVSTTGALTAALLWREKNQTDADRKVGAGGFILEALLFQGTDSLKLQ